MPENELDSMLDLEIVKREIPSNEVVGGESLAEDAVIDIESETLGKVSLVIKKTPYVENPADLMLTVPDLKISQLTEFEPGKGCEFIALCGRTVGKMHNQLGRGMPVIALNQQAECVYIPNKFAPDGTELKLQTINELHAHLFIEAGEGHSMGPASNMEVADQIDFMDPFGLAVGKLLYGMLDNGGIELPNGFIANYETASFPLGLTIKIGDDIGSATGKPEFFDMLQRLQSKYVELYYYVKCELTNEDGSLKDRQSRKAFVTEFLEGKNLEPNEQRALETIGIATRNVEAEPRKNMRLVQGPALTWVIYESEGVTCANMNFRIVSRGNASDALGVWVEPVGKADVERKSQLRDFYIELAKQLKQENAKTGPATDRLNS